jgi:hypothetical protein
VVINSCGALYTSKNKAIFVLLDLSASISQDVQDNYLNIITNCIMPKLGNQDILLIYPIDEGSVIQSESIYKIDLSVMNFESDGDPLTSGSDSIRYRKDKFLKKSVDSLRHIIHNKFIARNNYKQKTKIIDAINYISTQKQSNIDYGFYENTFEGRIDKSALNVIIILSDMIEDSNYVNFLTTENMDFSTINKKINLPDLSNCKVLIHGCSVDKEFINADKRFMEIKSFWKDFFK